MSTSDVSRRGRPVLASLAVALAAVLSVPLVLVLAAYEMKAVYAVAGGCVLAGGTFLLRHDLAPLLRRLRSLRPSTSSRPIRAERPPTRSPLSGSKGSAPKQGRMMRGLGLFVIAGAGAGLAWTAALLGTKGLVAAVGAVGLVSLLLFVKDKSVFFTFATVCSLALLLHKSFGRQDLSHGGGAISIYITTFDIMLLLLYGLWLAEGTLLADLREGLRRPLVWLPLLAVLFLLPSLLVAVDVRLAVAELVRMGWMYLLYVYLAVRVRTVRHVVAVLVGLAVVTLFELVVVLLQWRSGGVLGLGFLGIPESLIPRTTDTGEIGRPSGTILHPAFLAAALGIIAVLALALAIELQHRLLKIAAMAVAGAGVACMWISQTRASFVAVAMAGAVVVLVGLVRRRIGWRTIGAYALVGAAGVAIGWEKVSSKILDNFGTNHYSTEVESRLELNEVALRMIDDHPLLGVGLNNFENLLPRYEANPVIFPGYPVHNLYLLWVGEVGILGFVGVALLGIGLYDAAIRLGRSQDRLLAGIGIGTAGAMAFVMIEELLGYTLRGDVPLALYWVLAGLVAAGTQLSGRPWPGPLLDRRPRTPSRAAPARAAEPPATSRPPARLAGRASRLVAGAGALGLAASLTPLLPTAMPGPAPIAVAATSKITFSGKDRATDREAVYVADLDGTNIKKVSPNDDANYDWGRFAFGNTKIVYTKRTGPIDSPEDIYLMNADGSGTPQLLREFNYPVVQPVIDQSGRYLHYTAKAPFFPIVAQFRMDLRTGHTVNLTARNRKKGSFDADPYLLADGKQMVFVENSPGSGTSVEQTDLDGGNRRRLAPSKWFNTDPTVSDDGKTLVISSYRGEGKDSLVDPNMKSRSAIPEYWHLSIQPRRYGAKELVLTEGLNCTMRLPTDSCTPKEMSAFQPRFTADQASVAYVGAMDYQTTCICLIDRDGSNDRVLIASKTIAINWQDWPQPDRAVTSTAHIEAEKDRSRMLVTFAGPGQTRIMAITSPDLAHREPVRLPAGIEPTEARWGPDGKTIVFTALVEPGRRKAPHPAAPSGQTRRGHVTLDSFRPLSIHLRDANAELNAAETMRRQVFLRTPDGRVRQITDPWIEDWRDGLDDGDARGNSQPQLSADGRFVVVTNTSTTTAESFLLRIDLVSGEVVNLTNGTAGAVPTDDAEAAYAPDGDRLAFSWSEGSRKGVYLMDAGTGGGVTNFVATRDDDVSAPVFSRDGRSLAFVADAGKGGAVMRSRITGSGVTDVRPVSTGVDAAWSPVFSPAGDATGFLAYADNLVNFYAADGAAPARVVQPDVVFSTTSIDWK